MTGWTEATLGELGEAFIGLTYSPNQVSSSGTLVLRSSNIQRGRLDLTDTVQVNAQIPEKIRVRESDVLICVRNGSRRLIGKSLYLDNRVAGETFGAFMAVFRSPLNSYLRYFFESGDFKRQVDEHLGATINQITNASLRGFRVRYPGEAERDEIAARLADVDAFVVSLERLIAKKRAVKQGMMQELLTGRTRLPGFTGDWREVELGHLGVFLKGRGVTRDKVRSSGVPCIRYGELYTVYRDYARETVSFVDPDVSISALPVRSGDLLFAGSGETKAEIGMVVAYVGQVAAVAGGDIIVLRGAGFDPIFLASLLNTPSLAAQKASRGQGDAVVHIGAGALSTLRFRLPAIDEQHAIAEVLQNADAEIEASEHRLESARAVKIGMMQELLTGRTRLPFGGKE
ncbi:restriction endonuclease subunit S [Arthrobacter sp. zg-Y179]|uniref:restriction endonuclease subunit S n=1 Tax=Arthrobacter sp. zg-Y179 TaxID=2894188 RepID=UPI001E4A820C|nr:restriction endonuclease subunit S [Arthrobacter sp. zg-Y179]MCC9175457.1 restriction endonuclease subunit S [Arthrobacter sp. zg-Y179]